MSTVKPARTHSVPSKLEPRTLVVEPLVIATRIFNVLVPLAFVLFAWAHAAAFVHTPRISNVIMLATVVIWLQYYVRRYTGPFVGTSAYAWLIALGGTVAPLMFRPTEDASDWSAATAMQVAGAAMLIYVISTLQGSSEQSTARRGIRRDGWYRFVRHPLCLTFVVSHYGYLLNHAGLYNLCVCALVMLFLVLRINEEERLLLDDEEFQEYVRQTPWRVIPRVF